MAELWNSCGQGAVGRDHLTASREGSQRLLDTLMATTSTARGDSRPAGAVPASFEHTCSALTVRLLAGSAAAGTRAGACRHPGILVRGTG